MASLDVNMADMEVPAQQAAQQVENLRIDSPSEDDVDSYDSTDDSSIDEAPVVHQGLPTRDLPTGLCYDERMRYHAEIAALSAEAVHPEDPRRIYYIYKELCQAGLVVQKDFDVMVSQPLLRIDAREATKEEIERVHTTHHWEFLKRTQNFSNDDLIDLSEATNMDSIYFNKLSFFSGLLSAGGAIETCKAVMEGKVKNAIAVIRPPGHHAEVDKPMGFCLFNNTCVASRACQDAFGMRCRKVLILDWDVHHGNGCQNAFYNDPNILYISLHVHQNGKFYPSGPEGGNDRCGAGAGEGYNVNIGWETKGMGDGDYMYAFQHVVMPIATSFDPDLVIVSAGFDAAAGDELGGCNVTPACYAHMTHMLMSLAKGKIAVCLEGGYNFRAISRSAVAVTKTLMGEAPDRLEATSATLGAVRVIEEVKRIQSRYWKCMYPKAPTSGIYGGEKLHDIIRRYQAQHMFDNYKLTELHILRDKISKSFDKQVLGSLSYDRKRNLIVFFHDPPDLLTNPDPLRAQQKPHDTWMAYIEWATKSNIGIIDINIPESITITADPKVDETRIHYNQEVQYDSKTTDVARLEAKKLASYVWENYIEPYEFEGIWLIGAGNAFHAVATLIGDNESIYQRVRGVVAFICDTPARPISSVGNNNTWIMSWYRENSKVYVARDHPIWQRELQEGKKISKRFGKLIKSQETILNSMLQAHLPDVFAWIKETGSFEDMETDSSDPNGTDEDRPPTRAQALSSPPQTRPLTASATAQSSAALRSALSPRGTSAAPAAAGQSQHLSPPRTGGGVFTGIGAGASPTPRSPAPQVTITDDRSTLPTSASARTGDATTATASGGLSAATVRSPQPARSPFSAQILGQVESARGSRQQGDETENR